MEDDERRCEPHRHEERRKQRKEDEEREEERRARRHDGFRRLCLQCSPDAGAGGEDDEQHDHRHAGAIERAHAGQSTEAMLEAAKGLAELRLAALVDGAAREHQAACEYRSGDDGRDRTRNGQHGEDHVDEDERDHHADPDAGRAAEDGPRLGDPGPAVLERHRAAMRHEGVAQDDGFVLCRFWVRAHENAPAATVLRAHCASMVSSSRRASARFCATEWMTLGFSFALGWQQASSRIPFGSKK